jgi:hypothetical protein
MKDTVSRLSIKIVRHYHHGEPTGKLMEEGRSEHHGGTGTFLAIW